MGERDRTETVVLLAVWVLPLLAAAGLLVAAGLAWLAVTLLAVEAAVAGAVAVARRRPDAADPAPARPWTVPAAMLLVLVALVGVTLLAVRLG